jgi:hypothetical protein
MMGSREGMHKTRAKGELHLDRPLQVIVRRPIEDLEEQGSSDSIATEMCYYARMEYTEKMKQ